MELKNTVSEIPSKKISAFARTVTENKGRVLLFVHPSIRSLHSSKEEEELVERTIETINKSKIPVIILENSYREDVRGVNTQKTKEFLNRINNKKAITLPTFLGDPELKIKPDETPIYATHPNRRTNALISFLEMVGAKKINLGGAFAQTTHKEHTLPDRIIKKIKQHERERLPKIRYPSKKPIAYSCAGTTYADLIQSEKFKVKLIPGLIRPEKPHYPVNKNKLEKIRKAFGRFGRVKRPKTHRK